MTASLYRLQKETGMTATMWRRYFSGETTISERSLKKASNSLQIDYGDIIRLIDARRDRMAKN